MYLNLTDTGSCSSFFNFICKKECTIKESESRNLIFEILKQSEIAYKIRKIRYFWSILVSIWVARLWLTQYFEKFENRTLNKKHQGVRRDTKRMNFESYAEGIETLREPGNERNKKQILQKRLQVTNTKMKITSINTVQFTSLNDKRYYFSDGILSLLYRHILLSKIFQIKKAYPKILSQTNVFNIFPILESVCIRKTKKCIPKLALWVSRLFIELANRNDKVGLTLDWSSINKDGPGRFITEADKQDFQTCYFNVANDE